MRSPFRILRRRQEYLSHRARRRELELELSEFFAEPVVLGPAPAKGGYDQIYLASSAERTIAVVRVNNPRRTQDDVIGPLDPGVPLGPSQRLDREWEAYSRLSPLDLSPRPLWRTEDAIACSWSSWERASNMLIARQDACWDLAETIFPAIGRMHDASVVHLDLSTGNLLVEQRRRGVNFIDFEFGPTAWATIDQQMAFDYLRLLDDLLRRRRAGPALFANPDRVVTLLDRFVPEKLRAAPMRFALSKLKRLAASTAFRERLTEVFPGLAH